MFKRPLYHVLAERIAEPRRFTQALMGLRQTGKTTLAQQVLDELEIPEHYATADEPVLKVFTWIEQQWETTHIKSSTGKGNKKALLVLDEVQKITGCSKKQIGR